MKQIILFTITALLCTSFTFLPASSFNSNSVTGNEYQWDSTKSEKPLLAALYEDAGLDDAGLNKEAFALALKGYEQLNNEQQINLPQYLSIVDYSQPSSQKRFYILDVANKKLLVNTYISHGRNSGTAMATHFSNKEGSLESSLGFFITADVYEGKNGISLRLKGLEKGINDHAYERTIVLHGADYVNESRAIAGDMMGRSWGCPAVPMKEASAIIDTIKDGTCLFIYHPQEDYLQHSSILND